jgi:hypothetical protein
MFPRSEFGFNSGRSGVVLASCESGDHVDVSACQLNNDVSESTMVLRGFKVNVGQNIMGVCSSPKR